MSRRECSGIPNAADNSNKTRSGNAHWINSMVINDLNECYLAGESIIWLRPD